MKKWQVTGADRTTGADKSLTIEAETRGDAERLAVKDHNLVVSVIEPAKQQRPACASPGRPPSDFDEMLAQSDAKTPAEAPSYAILVRRSRTLEFCGGGVMGMGVVLMFLGAGLMIIIAASGADRRDAAAVSWASAIGTCTTGLWLAIVGVILRLLAALALAVRDIARNSFRPR